MTYYYEGIAQSGAGAREVRIHRGQRNGVYLDPAESQRLRNHSPDGFNWGYGGSGPAQLALALLLHATGDSQKSLRLYQHFKFDVIAKLPQDAGWRLDRDSILLWVAQHEREVAHG